MKTERSDISFPVWRKKVDSTILKDRCTPLPGWVMKVWDIEQEFGEVTSKKDPHALTKIIFRKKEYSGYVARTTRSKGGVFYRLFISPELCEDLKKVYLMSYIRSIESHLRDGKNYKHDTEKDIPFWEFLDIEYNITERTFHFAAHYTQEPLFPELFRSLVKSTVLKQFETDDELEFIKSDWLPKSASAEQINANNVIYYLIDTQEKLFYIGQAEQMHKRFEQGHLGMKSWDFFRFDILPAGFSKKQRMALERMLIRCFATILINKKNIMYKDVSGYQLANIKIDNV